MAKIDRSYTLGVPTSFKAAFIWLSWLIIIFAGRYDWQLSNCIATPSIITGNISTYSHILFCYVWLLGGVCIYKGFVAIHPQYETIGVYLYHLTLLLVIAVSDQYYGTNLRAHYEIEPGSIKGLIGMYCLWYLIYSPLVWSFARCFLSDQHPRRLLRIGFIIIMGSILAPFICNMLTGFAARPRYSYLLTLSNPVEAFRSWFEWQPYVGAGTDAFDSWPSSYMASATVLMCTPMFADVSKVGNRELLRSFFYVSSITILVILGYAQIVQQRHFLTDVVSGAFIAHWVFTKLEEVLRATF